MDRRRRGRLGPRCRSSTWTTARASRRTHPDPGRRTRRRRTCTRPRRRRRADRVSDIDTERAAAVAAAVGGSTVPADDAIETPCDLFAPCSVAKVVTPDTAALLQCRMIVGAANDTLSDPGCATLLPPPDHLRTGLRLERRWRDPHPQPARRPRRGPPACDVMRIGARTREILETASALVRCR